MSYLCENWPLDPNCLPTGWEPDQEDWTADQLQAVEAASEILHRLTAGVYGLCSLKIRPCRRRCEEYGDRYLFPLGVSSGPWTPTMIDGRVYNITCGCAGECGCSPLCEIVLDPYAYDILQVKVDGAILPPSAYRVDDHRRLVRIDGACWPECQELALPDTAAGTFSITYRTGTPVPAGGRMAVTDLAVQLWKACSGAAGCVLPQRVTQVVREGVSYTLLDNMEVFDRGRTGLSRVDLWLSTVNPYNAKTQMRAWSPDTVRARRTTFPDQVGTVPPVPPVPGWVPWSAVGQAGGVAPLDLMAKIPLQYLPDDLGDFYLHVQSTPAAVWTVQHNLGHYPSSVSVFSADFTTQYDDFRVHHIDLNQLLIETSMPIAGVAPIG